MKIVKFTLAAFLLSLSFSIDAANQQAPNNACSILAGIWAGEAHLITEGGRDTACWYELHLDTINPEDTKLSVTLAEGPCPHNLPGKAELSVSINCGNGRVGIKIEGVKSKIIGTISPNNRMDFMEDELEIAGYDDYQMEAYLVKQ